MYNSGNSSKNVTGSSIVDGTVETADLADDAVTNLKIATMAASKLTGALPAIDASALTGTFGVGQTWQTMTASRAAGTTYTNSTGRPIEVSIGGRTETTVVGNVTVTIGGSVALSRYVGNQTEEFNFSLVVPTGATYVLDVVFGTTLASWFELR
jgi:hypothetical protein